MQSKQLPITTGKNRDHSASTGASPYWRSVDELENTPEFEQFLHREFPQAASEFPEGVSRRRWLKLMSASLALGGVAGCRYGPDQIAAFVVRPENTVAGVAKHYASNFELAGRAVHLLVSNMDGRPIKIEGNPDHPLMRASEPNDLSRGKSRFASAGTDVYSQACVLGLYDPDRAQRVAKRLDGQLTESNWQEFTEFARANLDALASGDGEGLAILMAPSLSPSVNRLVAAAAAKFPKASVVQFASVDDSAQRAASTQAAGAPAELHLDLSDAKIICCLDSDPLGNDPNMLLYSRQYSKSREPVAGKMNRLYSVESRFSVTGSAADSRLALRSSQIGAFIARLESRVDELVAGGATPDAATDEHAFDEIDSSERLDRFIDAMAEDLVNHKGTGVVTVGSHQPLDVQLTALRINHKLENVGKTVLLMPSRSAIEGVTPESIDDLVGKIDAGIINTVWVLGENPVYTAPANVKLGEALAKVENSVYLADFEDESAMQCTWSVPVAHQLESWGDVLAMDGGYGICQPQILPLLNGRSTVEILSLLLGQAVVGEEIVRETAGIVAGKPLTSRGWRETLHSGYLADVTAKPLELVAAEGQVPAGTLDLDKLENGSLEVNFVVSDVLYDGRFAKNVWLQELPQAITKLVWDNAALMSPKTAESLDLSQGDIVRLVHQERQVEVPTFILPGHAHGSITVHIGYGRVCRDEAVSSDEQVAVGRDVAPLRALDAMHVLTGVEARPTGRPYPLATTQDHFAIDDLGMDEIERRSPILVREGTLEQIEEGGKDYVKHLGGHMPPLESLWEEPMSVFEKDPTVAYQWGMTIDLNKCTGCNSCVVACQSENNVSVVGKEQVSRGREMHWIRIDRYFRGDRDAPQMVHQPVACAHCETAPCEQVCPVAATVHTEEGINTMAYNRCVGTRYCGNNCPYKVRRFNYFNYTTEYGYFYGWQQRGKLEEASRKLQQLVLNPDVSVRGRGVMEKCSYCIQRVQNGKINARNAGRAIEDGEVQSACQAACPTQAIVFGDIKDPNTKVSQMQHSPRAYDMLAELNIKPRTRYLARVRNTHPRLKTRDQLAEAAHGHAGESHAEGGADHGSAGHEEDNHGKEAAAH
ncbi:TAT-variant-translocated molybdopterin oxidoreductase [Aureliella helgolandensis]|uniref:Tetrathionate reductase subunit B n=1 Tax=Aureliella helgolandensis TaxID=2527968 RepID=A0A518G127_9BACT|nr:TAT-variant-translocated molybdopterin oxidoreductase [Aureliella helgolandensis]QDV22307.1 Tetrathionate reductase subunit B precursor [Aureliella helgolandensis]